jgi:hypothetical protein
MTKAEAKRKLRALIEESGLNTEEHLLQSVRMVRTFAEEANWWKENKLSLRKPSVQEMWGGYVDRYFVPHFGKLPLDAVDERRVQEFISVLNKTYYTKSNGKKKKLEAVSADSTFPRLAWSSCETTFIISACTSSSHRRSLRSMNLLSTSF